jgi:hypothetical protein
LKQNKSWRFIEHFDGADMDENTVTPEVAAPKRTKKVPARNTPEYREYMRKAKREQRARDKVARDAERAKQKQDDCESSEHGNENEIRVKHIIVYFGDTAPGVPARTFDEELAVAREFARALEQPDVIAGESLRSFCKRVFLAWPNHSLSSKNLGYDPNADVYVPGLARRSQRMHEDYGFSLSGRSFEETWVPPADGNTGDEVIDIASLAALPRQHMSAWKRIESRPAFAGKESA